MFRYFWLKFGFVVFSMALFCACLIFLFFNHNDTLKNFVPAEADIYFHSTANKINSLPINQRGFFFDWLEKHGSLSGTAWKNVLTSFNAEIGLFSINKQVFAIAKPTKKLLSALETQDISFLEQKGAVIFPNLQISEEKLAETAWFSQSFTTISFSDALVYVKDISNLPLPLLVKANNEPLTIRANISSNTIKLEITGPVGQSAAIRLKRQLNTLPANAVLYFHDILTEKITEKAEFIPQNFKFHLLKTLKGPIEYLETKNGFIVFGLKKYNPQPAIQQNIAAILAQTFPVIKSKLLPDSTLSKQLIADPEQWKFQVVDSKRQQITTLNEPKSNLNIELAESANYFSIKNNFPQQEQPLSTKINSIFSPCSIFHNHGALFYPVNTQLGAINLVIINKNEKKIHVCIE